MPAAPNPTQALPRRPAQPRDRAVSCRHCRQETFDTSAMCGVCARIVAAVYASYGVVAS